MRGALFESPVSVLYLRTPSMAGVQGGRVVLLYTLIHTQVAHFRVTDLKYEYIFKMTLFSFFSHFSHRLCWCDSPHHRTACRCTSSSRGKHCQGTIRSFYTAEFSSGQLSERCLHNQYRGSARAQGVTIDGFASQRLIKNILIQSFLLIVCITMIQPV